MILRNDRNVILFWGTPLELARMLWRHYVIDKWRYRRECGHESPWTFGENERAFGPRAGETVVMYCRLERDHTGRHVFSPRD